MEEGNPLIEFYAAVARCDTTGFSAEGWHPELAITREESLKSLTVWGAMAAFEEDLKGSLLAPAAAASGAAGATRCRRPGNERFCTKALMTIVGGKGVFQRAEMR
ncbi:hypothetical protein L0337_24750 [candidate division KSB1 bacterium]|nr:hypothetical protein [candidate division KSB1 bacterium]